MGQNEEIGEKIRRRLENHKVDIRAKSFTSLGRASVLIPIFFVESELHLLLTKRAIHLNTHGGEVSFPGGKEDENDRDHIETALREAEEEIGLSPEVVTVIGVLDQVLSKTNLLVTPVVGIIPAPGTEKFPVNLNIDEVQEIFSVPLSFFLQSPHPTHTTQRLSWHGKDFLLHFFTYDNYTIFGLTALIILRFLEVVFDFKPEYPLYAYPDHWKRIHETISGSSSVIKPRL